MKIESMNPNSEVMKTHWDTAIVVYIRLAHDSLYHVLELVGVERSPLSIKGFPAARQAQNCSQQELVDSFANLPEHIAEPHQL